MSATQPSQWTTVSILSLSTVSGISTVITGLIPQLTKQFPQVPTTVIEWLVTIANLSALITLLINPQLTQKFGIRPVVISGLLLSAVAGAFPMLSTNFTLIMLSRGILGLGIGLFSPHAISLIAHVYHGDRRARLLGYQTGLSALGNAVLLALAGWLVVISWQAVFWLYLVLALIAVLVWRFVPETNDQTATAKIGHAKLPLSHWGLAGLTFITYLLIWGVQLKLPSLFADRHFGDASSLNWTLAAMNLGGLVAGLTFGWLHKHLHRYTLTLGYAGAALSVALLWVTHQATIAMGAAIFFNFIYSYTGPYLVFTSNSGLANAQINTMSSYLTIATIISAFFAPLVWNLLGKWGPGVLTDNVMLWITLILALIAVASVFKPIRKGTIPHGK